MFKPVEEVIAEAIRAGIDLEMVEHNLTLSPEERARQHDDALRTVLELKRCGEEMRARDREAA
jgi:beta-glucosidase-like glycosyl hydrolase